MEVFAAAVANYVIGKALPPVMIDMNIGEWTLSGRIDGLYQSGLAYYRPAPLQPKDMLKIWIAHLVLNCTGQLSSILIGKELMQEYQPVTDSHSLLRELLGLYWQGLREPLRFFPRTSHAFAKAMFEPKEAKSPETLANAEWKEEHADEYIGLAFRNDAEPLNPGWQKLAIQVFAPLLAARRETKLSP
jgi:exodeoxyribonuclease V gamma subunit